MDSTFRLEPFDTDWKKGSSATPSTTENLFFGDAISISTAASKSNRTGLEAEARIPAAGSRDFHISKRREWIRARSGHSSVPAGSHGDESQLRSRFICMPKCPPCKAL
jgi:hypothetical protein